MRSLDIPQANARAVQQVVRAADWGATTVTPSRTTPGSQSATQLPTPARILGLVRPAGDEVMLTPLGERLVATEPREDGAQRRLRAIQGSAVIQLLVPDLLSLVPKVKILREALQGIKARDSHRCDVQAVSCPGAAMFSMVLQSRGVGEPSAQNLRSG